MRKCRRNPQQVQISLSNLFLARNTARCWTVEFNTSICEMRVHGPIDAELANLRARLNGLKNPLQRRYIEGGDVIMKAKTTILLLLEFAVVLIVLSGAVFGQDQPADKDTAWTGTIEQKIWALTTVWSEAKYNFPFFDQRPGLNWDEKVKEYLPRVIAAPDVEAYYDVLCEFAALLKDGHTAVNRPGGLFNPALDWPPLEVQVVDGKDIVARFEDTAELKRNQIHCGLEIVEIEGVPVDSYYRDRVVRD